MIELVTGTPGAGKTLRLVQRLETEGLKAARSGRPVLTNICGYVPPEDVPVTICDWSSPGSFVLGQLPIDALVFLDECQRVWPSDWKPSEQERADLSLHRHKGIDVIACTQSAMMMAPYVRRLVGRHEHLYRPGNLPLSTIMTDDGGLIEDVMRPPVSVSRSRWPHPRHLFHSYTSGSLGGTVKTRMRLPFKRLALVPFGLLLIGGAVLAGSRFVSHRMEAAKAVSAPSERYSVPRQVVSVHPGARDQDPDPDPDPEPDLEPEPEPDPAIPQGCVGRHVVGVPLSQAHLWRGSDGQCDVRAVTEARLAGQWVSPPPSQQEDSPLD